MSPRGPTIRSFTHKGGTNPWPESDVAKLRAVALELAQMFPERKLTAVASRLHQVTEEMRDSGEIGDLT